MGGKSLYLYTDKHNDDKRPYQSKGLVTKPEIVTIGVRRIICGAYIQIKIDSVATEVAFSLSFQLMLRSFPQPLEHSHCWHAPPVEY